MDNQIIPKHRRLWHRQFVNLVLAQLLLCLSATILIPSLPSYMQRVLAMTDTDVAMAFGAFGIGLFLFGPRVSYLVQYHHRGRVGMFAIFGFLLCHLVYYLLSYLHVQTAWARGMFLPIIDNLVMGMFFGLALMVLSGTLIIDRTESELRTQANQVCYWLICLSLSLGPILALVLGSLVGFYLLMGIVSVMSFVAVLLVGSVNFPFRVPDDDVRRLSCDRFFLTHAWPVFIDLLMVAMGAGVIFSRAYTLHFYLLFLGGVFVALIFANLWPRLNRTVTLLGLLSLLVSCILAQKVFLVQSVTALTPLLAGFGLSLIGVRFQAIFLDVSRHCQRGTSLSTFLLACTSGVVWGLALGYLPLFRDNDNACYLASGLVAFAFIGYFTFVHRWFHCHHCR